MSSKPHVVALGTPKFVGNDYLEEFKKDFHYTVSKPQIGHHHL